MPEHALRNRLDKVFLQIGEFGTYQFISLALIGLMAFQTAVRDHASRFIDGTPDYRFVNTRSPPSRKKNYIKLILSFEDVEYRGW